MTLHSHLHSHLPEGWVLSNLIYLDPEWQVNIRDDEGVIVATGASIEESLHNATVKAYEGTYVGRFKYDPAPNTHRVTNLAERLGFVPKPTTINRR